MTTNLTNTRLSLYRLTMVEEEDGVMVGRPDTASYALFPPEGAEILRMLEGGETLASAGAWYELACGEVLDLKDFLEALADLGFIRLSSEDRPPSGPVRWQRLGRAVFSAPAWIFYAVMILAAITLMTQHSNYRPTYRHIFFTHYISLIPAVLMGGMIPCVLLHESFHALAGRRLGLPSELNISRRMYYVVAETNLDCLLSVPRRSRVLPFLAGILADMLLIAAFTLIAAGFWQTGSPTWIPGLFLAMAFGNVIRLLWQFLFHLQTDLYFVLSHALGCSDLHDAAKFCISLQVNRLLGRRPSKAEGFRWSDRDLSIARWYAPLIVIGYAFSIASLIWAGIPTLVHFWSVVAHRLLSNSVDMSSRVDAVAFLIVNFAQWAMLGYVTLRDRQRRRSTGLTPEV